VGLDNIDIETATRHGVLVMNTPRRQYSGGHRAHPRLMLALCRNIVPGERFVKRESGPGVSSGGSAERKILGVIGWGGSARGWLTRCQAFRMKVMAYDPYISEEAAERIHVRLVGGLEELLREAEFVTVHTALTEETAA